MRIFKQSNSDIYKLSYSNTSKQSYSDTYNQSYSDLFRVSIDPRVKPEGDEIRKNVPNDGGIINMYRNDNYYKVMPRFGTNRQGIFELVIIK